MASQTVIDRPIGMDDFGPCKESCSCTLPGETTEYTVSADGMPADYGIPALADHLDRTAECSVTASAKDGLKRKYTRKGVSGKRIAPFVRAFSPVLPAVMERVNAAAASNGSKVSK